MLSRRELLLSASAAAMADNLPGLKNASSSKSIRCINIVNFLRAVEPRGPMDLFKPLQKQMEIVSRLGLPATWLLQYDALVSGPFVEYLKANMPKNHEVGIWFEMNEMHCKAAGVNWRGRPGYEWDHYPFVAFTIGYTHEERIKLADAFMSEFKKVWGKYPSSVASWNLDSFTMALLCEKYSVDAFAVCRDQIATDGFTIWGAPIAGWYPSRQNCWSPATSRREQLSAPVLKMLGQDPTYYYFRNGFPMPNGQRGGGPITMEPVWPSGRSDIFIQNFLNMIAQAPTMGFAYAQLGQENSFGWDAMEPAYEKQMKALESLRGSSDLFVETMGETGRRFKKAFRETPVQAQVMLNDSLGNSSPEEKTIWYQSRFYRANLHLHGDLPFLRDLTVYKDSFAQPFLNEPTRLHDVEQRMPAIMDGYHWSKTPGSAEPGAGGFFELDGVRLRATGPPVVKESGRTMLVELPVSGGRTLHLRFEERRVVAWLTPGSELLGISFEWDLKRATSPTVTGNVVHYQWQNVEYSVRVSGSVTHTEFGWRCIQRDRPIRVEFA